MNRLVGLFYRFKDRLPSYTRARIAFPGVEINSVAVTELKTFFSPFRMDATNAVDVVFNATNAIQPGSDHSNIMCRSMRLDNRGFNFTLNVTSDQEVSVAIRTYLGPKFDYAGNVLNINDKRKSFFLLDVMKRELEPGVNYIRRYSKDFSHFAKDPQLFSALHENVLSAINGTSTFSFDNSNGFPARLMLPQGTKEGKPFELFFIVSPLQEPVVQPDPRFNAVGYGYVDILSYGFPFDRIINETIWPTMNMYFQNVSIMHTKR